MIIITKIKFKITIIINCEWLVCVLCLVDFKVHIMSTYIHVKFKYIRKVSKKIQGKENKLKCIFSKKPRNEQK